MIICDLCKQNVTHRLTASGKPAYAVIYNEEIIEFVLCVECIRSAVSYACNKQNEIERSWNVGDIIRQIIEREEYEKRNS